MRCTDRKCTLPEAVSPNDYYEDEPDARRCPAPKVNVHLPLPSPLSFPPRVRSNCLPHHGLVRHSFIESYMGIPLLPVRSIAADEC